MTAQIIYLTIFFLGLLISAFKHGKPRPNYNIWVQLIAVAIHLTILYCGGFFDCFINN